MTTMSITLFALGLMAAVLLVLFAVVALTSLHKESKLNIDYFMSSTSMWFNRNKLNTNTAC